MEEVAQGNVGPVIYKDAASYGLVAAIASLS